MLTLCILIAVSAALTVLVAVIVDRCTPDVPHPDIVKIQRPAKPDPSIIIERRST
jgi:hypothetical protein